MSRLSHTDLATVLARNPDLRLNRGSDRSKPIPRDPAPEQPDGAGNAQNSRPSKYRNRKTEADGIVFASKKEANRYLELKTLEQAGKIRDLKLQPKYPLKVNGKLVCNYIADFAYWDAQSLVSVIEDTKGMKTPVYRLKKKLLLALYGNFEFRES